MSKTREWFTAMY